MRQSSSRSGEIITRILFVCPFLTLAKKMASPLTLMFCPVALVRLTVDRPHFRPHSRATDSFKMLAEAPVSGQDTTHLPSFVILLAFVLN